MCYHITMNDLQNLNELIDAIRMRHITEELREKYDHLIINRKLPEPKDPEIGRYLKIIRKYSFDNIRKLLEQKLIVSMTSFPPRMDTLHIVITSILEQTVKADEILLWLAEEQFPNRLDDLPEELKTYEKKGQIRIRWCDDLKPHKKYYYTMKENPDAIVVTIDDDVSYDKRALEYLLLSYLEYPQSVSALRINIISMKDGRFLPYSDWLKNPDILVNKPSFELLATGCGGTLYPPHLLPEELFDKEAIMKTCLDVDDLWLKAMELVNDVPVVLAHHYRNYPNSNQIPGSQKESLSSVNMYRNRNDEQLAVIKEWIDERYSKDFMEKKLSDFESPYVGGLTRISSCFQDIVKRNAEGLDKVNSLAQKNRSLKEENKKLKKELEQIKGSRSYKLLNKIRKMVKG